MSGNSPVTRSRHPPAHARRCGRHRVGTRQRSPGVVHDTRACAVLRRHGPQQERARDDGAEPRDHRHRQHRLGSRGVLPGVRSRRRRRTDRHPALRRPRASRGAGAGAAPERPALAFAAFQMMFAVITAALLTGTGADRMRFPGFLAFGAIWTLVVYAPIAHWVFSPEGWLAQRGVLDFAGGNVVEIDSGASALALAWVLGPRRGWPREAMAPHSLPLTVIGAGILWFGWFGFNAGSALAANGLAAQAFIGTQLA